jgi:hypothetical protein
VENVCFVPVFDRDKNSSVDIVLVLVNRIEVAKEKIKKHSSKLRIKFTNSYMPWTNPVF